MRYALPVATTAVLQLSGPASTMNLQITSDSLDTAGVQLLVANSPTLDERLAAILPSRSVDIVKKLKPYVAIVTNRSKLTLVAYTVLFRATRANGTSDETFVQFKFPDAVAGTAVGRSPIP